MALYFLLPLFLILPLTFLNLIKKMKRKKNKLPPGPPKLPIIGNLHQLGPLAHQSLWNLSRKYGPVMLMKLGSYPTYIISSSNFAKEVVKVHDIDCCSRPALVGTGKLSYNYLDIAFSPYGEYWREIRKLTMLELLSTKRVNSYRSIREEEVGFLVDLLDKYALSSSSCDLSKTLLTFSANIMCRMAFGKKFTASFDSDRFQHAIHEGLVLLGACSASDFFPKFGWIIDRINGYRDRLEKNFKELDGFYQEVITDHVNSSNIEEKEEDDIMDVLLKVEMNQKESNILQLKRDHMKAILMNIFLAGVDTAAVTLVWALSELLRKPIVMKKAQEEIRNYMTNKGKFVGESEIQHLKYLKNVVKETLRLHPPAPILNRETVSHFKLNGYDIEPKTRVQVNVWGIGRDPKLWDEPEEFRPERFDDSVIDYNGQNFEYLPFGSERRGCPGIFMGATTVELTLANLLYSFDWKLPNGIHEIDMEEIAEGLTISNKVPLCLVPVILSSVIKQ